MFIPANEIEILIRAAKAMQERMPEEQQWIHARDIEATLQKLIDDELARLDKMADEFQDRDQAMMDEAMIADHEDHEYGKAASDWAQQEKKMDDETRKIQDWPGGL